MTRTETISRLRKDDTEFDVVVVGGGITGAGAAREAAGSGLRTLLVEQKDFAWGTSSRSSKMVHGGLRYLGSGHIGLTRDALRERQRMLEEAPGLVDPVPFIMPHYKGQFPGPGLFQALLSVYDRLAGTHTRQRLTPAETLQWVPGLARHRLIAASGFTDALTDDARLVQRLIAEATDDGALCLNYVKAQQVRRDGNGQVSGLLIVPEGEIPENGIEVKTARIINATGAWADQLQKQGPAERPLTIRPLRGSHLVVPWQRLPVTCAVSLLHPVDKRPVFAFPWAGATVLGTTDLDHSEDLNQEPAITRPEVEYLLEIADQLFPDAGLQEQDVLSTWAGVRPVVTEGQGKAPSKESREHSLRSDKGLISIAGGKLTTFRQISREALECALGGGALQKLRADQNAVFTSSGTQQKPAGLHHLTWRRLKGYYGNKAGQLLDQKEAVEIANTGILWAELEWACKHEQVVHLDDLMLRRSRLGLIQPKGGETLLPAIREHCQCRLGWDDARWHQEVERYLTLYRQAYHLPMSGAQ